MMFSDVVTCARPYVEKMCCRHQCKVVIHLDRSSLDDESTVCDTLCQVSVSARMSAKHTSIFRAIASTSRVPHLC